MRIAQIAPLAERVPPEKYGGTERVIYTLTEELVKRGHEVTLFASGDSKTSAKLESVVPISLRKSNSRDIYGFNLPTMENMGLAYSRQEEFDIIHDHGPHISLPTANMSDTPVVMTWHGPYSPDVVNYFSLFPKPKLVSISDAQAKLAPELSFAGTVYNGLYMNDYPFTEKRGDYLLFVGRMDMEKAPHIAIEVAVKLNKKLIIGAKLDDQFPHIKWYFEKRVQPRLKRYAHLVTWVGEVDDQQRNELMKNALCFLHPVTWPEPFGLTLIEAAACGCPTVAFGLGSIPEIVEDGKTGFIVQSVKEMVDAVKKIGTIQKLDCRNYVLTKFSGQKMADGYEQIYKRVLEQNKKSA